MDNAKKNTSTVVYFDELGFGWLMNAEQMKRLREKEVAETEWEQRILVEPKFQSTLA